MTASEVARAMNTTPQAVYNWEKGKNRPASRNLLALAQVFRVDGARFIEGEIVLLADDEATSNPDKGTAPATPREVEFAPEAPAFDQIGGPRNVPELGISVGGEDGDFTLNGETIDFHTRPASLAKRNVFAVRVKGTSMEPRFDEGDLLYAERNREPRIGEDGVFEMKPTDEWAAGKAFIKRLVSKGMGVVVVEQFNPPRTLTYKRDEIKDMYRVVPRNELLSV